MNRKWGWFAGVVLALVGLMALAPMAQAQEPASGYGYGPGNGDCTLFGGAFGPGAGKGHGRGGHMGGPELSLIAVAAEQLGMDRQELQDELKDGKTFVELAAEKGVDPQDIVDAFIAPRAERLAQAVTDGRLTQDEADAILGRMTEHVTEHLSEPCTLRESVGRGRWGR